jgi:Fe-S oxidoreductase
MPALREADPGALVLADGLSCRTQIRELSDRKPMHIAQVIAGALASRENARALRRSATSNS